MKTIKASPKRRSRKTKKDAVTRKAKSPGLVPTDTTRLASDELAERKRELQEETDTAPWMYYQERLVTVHDELDNAKQTPYMQGRSERGTYGTRWYDTDLKASTSQVWPPPGLRYRRQRPRKMTVSTTVDTAASAVTEKGKKKEEEKEEDEKKKKKNKKTQVEKEKVEKVEEEEEEEEESFREWVFRDQGAGSVTSRMCRFLSSYDYYQEQSFECGDCHRPQYGYPMGIPVESHGIDPRLGMAIRTADPHGSLGLILAYCSVECVCSAMQNWYDWPADSLEVHSMFHTMYLPLIYGVMGGTRFLSRCGPPHTTNTTTTLSPTSFTYMGRPRDPSQGAPRLYPVHVTVLRHQYPAASLSQIHHQKSVGQGETGKREADGKGGERVEREGWRLCKPLTPVWPLQLLEESAYFLSEREDTDKKSHRTYKERNKALQRAASGKKKIEEEKHKEETEDDSTSSSSSSSSEEETEQDDDDDEEKEEEEEEKQVKDFWCERPPLPEWLQKSVILSRRGRPHGPASGGSRRVGEAEEVEEEEEKEEKKVEKNKRKSGERYLRRELPDYHQEVPVGTRCDYDKAIFEGDGTGLPLDVEPATGIWGMRGWYCSIGCGLATSERSETLGQPSTRIRERIRVLMAPKTYGMINPLPAPPLALLQHHHPVTPLTTPTTTTTTETRRRRDMEKLSVEDFRACATSGIHLTLAWGLQQIPSVRVQRMVYAPDALITTTTATTTSSTAMTPLAVPRVPATYATTSVPPVLTSETLSRHEPPVPSIMKPLGSYLGPLADRWRIPL